MAYRPLTDIPLSLFGNSSTMLTGGVLRAYVTGTPDPATLYSDANGTSAGTSVTLDARGEPTTIKRIWLDTAVTYKLTLEDADGNVLWTADPVYGSPRGDASNLAVTATGSLISASLSDRFARVFDAKNYCTGDGVADDTAGLVALIADVRTAASNVLVVFPHGRYRFAPNSHYSSANAWRAAIELVDVHNVTIWGYGATLAQDIPDSWNVGDSANYGNDEGAIQFRSSGDGTCYNIGVVGISCEMVKLNYSAGVGDGNAHGIALKGVKHYVLRDCRVTDAPTDGIYVGATYSDTYSGGYGQIINCTSDGANRNCLSVVQNDNVKIIGGFYLNADGGSMQAGIDLEPDSGQNQSNILVQGVTISGNTNRGITSIRSSNVKIVNCDIFNNGSDITVEGSSSRVRIENNNITPNQTAGLGIDVIGNYNTDIDVEYNTIHMSGTPNMHVRVGYGGATGMRNIKVNDNTLVGEGGIDVRNVSGICQVNGNTHDVRLINGSLSDTNLFTWYIEPTTAEVNDNTIRIDSSITWSGTQNKFQIVNGTANRNKFDSHSGAVCVMYGRTTAFPVEYGYNEWSTYFYYDEGLSSDHFRIKRKGSGIVYEGDTTYGRRIVTGGYARTTNINAVDNQVGDVTYNYGTTSGNPVAYCCTVAGTAGPVLSAVPTCSTPPDRDSRISTDRSPVCCSTMRQPSRPRCNTM